jgi:hypothetical protein
MDLIECGVDLDFAQTLFQDGGDLGRAKSLTLG